MALTQDDARKLFGKFVSFNQMLSDQTDEANYYGFNYRMDTWQLWADCDEEHLQSNNKLDRAEFAIMMGPFDLIRGDDPEVLYRQMVKSVKAVLATSSLHIHALGYPCHDDCQCEEILSDEEFMGDREV